MEKSKNTLILRFLNAVEKGGNKLPDPVILFIILSAIVIVISAIAAITEVSVSGNIINRSTGELEETTITAISLLSVEGIRHIFTSAVGNFTGFAPLGVVLVAMIGVGVAESSGFISALLKKLVSVTPKRFITPTVVFLGIMSSVAADVGYVVLIPLGAIIFAGFNKHPLAGLAAAFAGVSGGFSANLLIGSIDPLLSGLSQSAGQIMDSTLIVGAESNYYFMLVSTILITVIGTFVTEKILIPKLGEYKSTLSSSKAEDNSYSLTDTERQGIKYGLIGLLLVTAFILALIFSGVLTDDQGNIIGRTPFIGSIVVIISLFFMISGVFYGYGSGQFKNGKDFVRSMDDSMRSMASYIVLAFFAAQFINYFSYSNLGLIISFKGAEFLESAGFTGIGLIISFIIITGFINLFIGSASAKWAIMAPVFVPMLMQLGYHPAFVQLAYRIGDSTTNIITPLLPYFAIIISFAQKYDKNAGIGTLVSMMLPYSIALLIGWTILLIIWFIFALPIGPAYGIFYP